MLSRGLRRWVILAAAVVLLVGAYAAFGFLGVPRLLRSNLESFVNTHYSRHVSIGEIRFNPFTLTLDVRALSFPDADGRPMLGLGRLFANLGTVSIWRRAPSFQEIAIDEPFAHVVIRRDGSLNLADLSKGFAAGEAKPPGSQPMRLFIDKLSVRSGGTVYEDRSRPDPFVAELKPITFDLRDFSTTTRTGNAYSLEAVSEAGERFNWSGTLEVAPVSSRGHFELDHVLARTLWSYARDSLGFEIPSGTLALAGDYEFTSAGNPIGARVDVHDLTVTDLGLRPKGKDANLVDLTRIELHDARLDLAKRSVQIAKVRFAGGSVHVWRDRNGSINLLELASPAGAAPAEPEAHDLSTSATTSPAGHPPPLGWIVSAPDVAIEGFEVSGEDRQVTPTVAMTLDAFNAHIGGFTTAPDSNPQIEAEASLNRSGKIKASAKVSLSSGAVSATAELSGLELTAFQPYIAQQTSMTLLSGVVGTKLTLERGADGALAVAGDTDVTNLRTVDNALQKDFLKWDDVHVSGVDFHSRPAKLQIKSVDAHALYARVIIASNQVLNITEVLTAPGAQASDSKVGSATPGPPTAANATAKGQGRAVATEKAPSSAPPLPISIGTVRIISSSAHFADYSIQPNYAVAIQGLNGTIAGLSSDPRSRAKLKLEGKVDRYAPVNIEGDINLLSASAYSDIRMSFKGVELSSVTPYSGRFAGYKIDKGKLSADLSYHIERRKLQAEHHIVIDQLQLGERVESPEATKLPLRLAVALLKDRNGIIDLGLPVTGSLDDPQFKLGPLIWKVVVNLVTKAATAPFALLGRLFGGGEEMNLIDFKPGSATLDATGQERIASLVKAMKERPQLELDVPVAFSPDLDRPALARRALQGKLVALKQKDASGRKQSVPADDTSLADPAEHFRLLAAEYRVELGKDAPLPDSAAAVEAAKKKKGETPAFDPAIADLEAALIAKVQVTESDFEELGKRRAHSIQEALLGGGEVAAGRVFLIDAPPKADAKDVVRLELALK